MANVVRAIGRDDAGNITDIMEYVEGPSSRWNPRRIKRHMKTIGAENVKIERFKRDSLY